MKTEQPLAAPDAFRAAMRHWVAGVTIVTSAIQAERHGMTVSSFTSISLSPPMILISLDRSTRTYALIARSGVFAVTILGADQVEISERFAGRLGDDEDRFAGLPTETLVSKAPLLSAGLAFFDCKVVACQEAGTSMVFFAEVVAARSVPAGEPLVYSNQTYYKLQK